jgi:hypothetical protein
MRNFWLGFITHGEAYAVPQVRHKPMTAGAAAGVVLGGIGGARVGNCCLRGTGFGSSICNVNMLEPANLRTA